MTATYWGGTGQLHPWLRVWFDVQARRSLPVIYQAGLLLALGGLAALAARPRQPRARVRPGWTVAAALCLSLALAQLTDLPAALEDWLLPVLAGYTRLMLAAPAAVVLGVLYWQRVPALPRRPRRLAGWAGLAYGLGVVGHIGAGPVGFAIAAAIAAEALKIAGLSLLLLGLLEHAALQGEWRLQVLPPGASPPAPDPSLLLIRPAAVLKGLSVITAALVVLGTLAMLASAERGGWLPEAVAQRLSPDAESSLPTAYNGVLLLLAALVLAGIVALKRQARDRLRPWWSLLAVAFLYLAVDELAVIHEHLSQPLHRLVDLAGVFRFAWVVPVIPLVALFGLLYGRFLFQLTPRTRALFVLAAGIYVGGALGFEMLGGWVFERYTEASLLYLACRTAEEALEMFGAGLFVYALLDYVGATWGKVRIKLNPH